MAYTRKTTKASAPAATEAQADTQEVSFHSLGALFETSSDRVPLVGPVDDDIVAALELPTPEGKEWKLFTSRKQSRNNKEYLSLYLGLSDKR